MKIAASIFKTLFLCLCIIANTHLAYAQTASILPQGKTQFLDNNGKPLTSGTVDFYIPSTTTRKTTWQNSAETVANSNPVVLDAGGRAIIYGDGSYRQVVKDRLGNVIWDQVTSSTGSGSGGSTATGDGDLVGTIKPWAGMTAPNQYVFTYGQEISRTTYSALFTAITSSQSVFCTSGSPTLTGLSDTTNFWVGASVEVSCLAAGFSTIISKTSSSITLASNANVSTNVTAIIFPWGRGNGTTTFNVPDLRGFAIAGNNNMGGVASSQLNTTYFGATDPNSVGAAGGNQSVTLVKGNMGSITPSGTISNGAITNGAITFPNVQGAGTAGGLSNNAVVTSAAVGGGVSLTVSLGPVQATTTQATSTFTGLPVGGGIATSATLGATGSGYTNGSQTITISGGTCTTQPQFTVTVSGNVFTGTPALLTAGSCTVAPNNPAATTGGGGTGGTLNVTYSAQPFSIIQPTKTSNYIIKITPDTNSATASGVTSLGGMTGDIACGTGLLCTGNNVSVVSGTTTIIVDGTPITGGVNRGLLYNNNGIVGNLSQLSLDVRKYAVAPKTASTVCNGSGDDTATIQAAANAANTNVGGTIDFPAGSCQVASPGIDLTNKGNITFRGQGAGRNLFAGVTSLVYTSATGSLFKMDGSIAVTVEKMGLGYSNASYNGDLIDLRQVSGTLNTNLVSIRDCFMYGSASNTAASFVRLGGPSGILATLSTRIERCLIQGAVQAIKGGLNSNNVYIANNFFNQGSSTSHIGLQGEGWTLLNNTFEPSTGTVGANVTMNGAVNGLAVIGNTFNDASTGTLIDLTGAVATGVSVTGNTLQGGSISLNAGSAVGVSIIGNYLNYNSVCGLVVNSATMVTVNSNSGVPATSVVCTLPSGVAYLIDKNDGGFAGFWASGIKLASPLEATQGGTGLASYAVGDILFANTTTTLSKLADMATGNALISGGVGVAPSWGKIGINTHVSGLGTGIATALGVNVGTAGAPVVNGGALGSPSSAGTIPAFTLGGTITGGGNAISGLSALGFSSTGSSSAPNITFNDADTGISGTAGTITFTENGVDGQTFSATQFIQNRSGGAPNNVLQRTDAHGAATIGTFVFRGRNTTPANVNYAQLAATVTNDATGSEAAYFSLQSLFGGVNVVIARVTSVTTSTGEITPNSSGSSALGSSTLPWSTVIANTLQSGAVAVGSLPTCNAAAKGTRHFVTDANATTFWNTVAGGGANNIAVTCDGTNWKIG